MYLHLQKQMELQSACVPADIAYHLWSQHTEEKKKYQAISWMTRARIELSQCRHPDYYTFLAMFFIRCTVFYNWATTEFQCKLFLLLLYYIQRWTENKRRWYLYFAWQHFSSINHSPNVYLVPRVFVHNHCAVEKNILIQRS